MQLLLLQPERFCQHRPDYYLMTRLDPSSKTSSSDPSMFRSLEPEKALDPSMFRSLEPEKPLDRSMPWAVHHRGSRHHFYTLHVLIPSSWRHSYKLHGLLSSLCRYSYKLHGLVPSSCSHLCKLHGLMPSFLQTSWTHAVIPTASMSSSVLLCTFSFLSSFFYDIHHLNVHVCI